jgi:hypothetical protein
LPDSTTGSRRTALGPHDLDGAQKIEEKRHEEVEARELGCINVRCVRLGE